MENRFHTLAQNSGCFQGWFCQKPLEYALNFVYCKALGKSDLDEGCQAVSKALSGGFFFRVI
jgi:hypothetical protein